MTRADAIQEYITLFYGDKYNLKRELETGDAVAVRCGFIDYVDTLAKEHRITEQQRNNWTCPTSWYK